METKKELWVTSQGQSDTKHEQIHGTVRQFFNK